MEVQQLNRQECKQVTRDHPLDKHLAVYEHVVSNTYF